jgi:2-phospho-L-lactate guanylyltransferase
MFADRSHRTAKHRTARAGARTTKAVEARRTRPAERMGSLERMAARPGDPLRTDGAPLEWLGPHVVLVPVKRFAEAKVRLAPALTPDARADLARDMAEAVIGAAQPLPVAVVCDDIEVADWARSRGALVVWVPGRGLNGAVEAGVAQLAAAGVRRVVVAHGDLPYAAGLARIAPGDGIVLVPDRRHDGTNVAVVPSEIGFRFSYGPGSFDRHLEEARRLGAAVEVLDDPLLAFDVDWPDDLDALVNAKRELR